MPDIQLMEGILIPNKQESLFCCGRAGVGYYVINCIQFMYLIIVAFFGYKLGMILVDEVIGMAIGAVGYILAFIAWFAVMPTMLDAFVISTSVSGT